MEKKLINANEKLEIETLKAEGKPLDLQLNLYNDGEVFVRSYTSNLEVLSIVKEVNNKFAKEIMSRYSVDYKLQDFKEQYNLQLEERVKKIPKFIRKLFRINANDFNPTIYK